MDGPWIDASFFLPRAVHCPVEVELPKGKTEVWPSTEGDWRPVKRWRSVEGKKKKGKD
jgi:hypothetical protein